MFNLTLYAVGGASTRLSRCIRDACALIKAYSGTDIVVVTKPVAAAAIRWTNCGERPNDRNGQTAFYCDVEPNWFALNFPTTGGDAIAVYVPPELWRRPEADFLELGSEVYVKYAAFSFTDPDIAGSYDLGEGEEADPLTWIFIHELSHIIFRQFMQVADPTHALDYQQHDLLAAVRQWSLARNVIFRALVTAYTKLLGLFTQQAQLSMQNAPLAHTSKLPLWADAIQKREGWYPGSHSYRNNNPGNLRYVGQRLATGQDAQGFCVFRTYADGRQQLINMLHADCTGGSTIYRPDMTLLQFYEKYAPGSDGNDPSSYADEVAAHIGVPVTTQIKNLV